MLQAENTDSLGSKVYSGEGGVARPWTACRRRVSAATCISLVVVGLYAAVGAYCAVGEAFGWKTGPAAWRQEVGSSYESPGGGNLLGTDMFGRSVLRKTLCGARVSLTVAVLGAVISVGIGTLLGVLAGFMRGVVDDVVVWVYSTLSATPYVLLVMAFAVVLREKVVLGRALSGSAAVCLAIGLTGWVGICRVVRGEVMRLREAGYVLAARSYGCGRWRIMFVHILPNVAYLVAADLPVRLVRFIHAEVVLSFLGLGTVGAVSWGTMISDARLEISRGVWWQMAAATGAIFVVSLALNLLGDAARERLDPKSGFGRGYGR